MDEPSYDPIEEAIEYITKIAEGDEDHAVQTEYFKEKTNSEGHFAKPWPELTVVMRRDMYLFCRFLLNLTLINRRIVLMRSEVIGYLQSDLSYLYSIHKDLIRRFKGQYIPKFKSGNKLPPKIRRIAIPSDGLDIDDRIIAFFAILMRVPPDWIRKVKPSMKWTTNHYTDIDHEVVDEKGLLTILQTINNIEDHNVMSVVLNFKGCELILRLEMIKGSYILEYVNEGLQLGVFDDLINWLGNMVDRRGVVHTVIPSHYNLAIIGGDSNELIPPAFQTYLSL